MVYHQPKNAYSWILSCFLDFFSSFLCQERRKNVNCMWPEMDVFWESGLVCT